VSAASRARQEVAVVAGLAKRAASVGRVAPGVWAFELANGTRFPASARIDDGWLLLDAPLHAAVPPSRWTELLEVNASLAGGARFILQAAEPKLRVRAEVPLDEAVDIGRRVVEACAGFEAAKTRLERPDVAIDVGMRDAFAAAGGDVSVAALCRETGWRCHERAADQVAVDLEVPGAFPQALVEAGPDASVAASMCVSGDAADDGALPRSSLCRDALALLLLRVSGAVRMVRATVVADGRAARFEVAFASDPAVVELAHAFAALSVACRVAVREAAVVRRDEEVARAYLEQWSSAHIGCAR
jgi:hypothetical protein